MQPLQQRVGPAVADEPLARHIGVDRGCGAEEQPLKHLGEAQTCFLITRRSEYVGSWWISDDKEALRYVRHQGITTHETIEPSAIRR